MLIVDYWIVRKRKLNLADLYLLEGEYKYKNGWNWKAVVATFIGCFFAWIGVVVEEMKPLYDYGWFVGFAMAGVSYLLMMKSAIPKGDQ